VAGSIRAQASGPLIPPNRLAARRGRIRFAAAASVSADVQHDEERARQRAEAQRRVGDAADRVRLGLRSARTHEQVLDDDVRTGIEMEEDWDRRCG